MSSIVNVVGDLSDEIADPGVVSALQKHVADGCPMAPLVECLTPGYDEEDRARVTAAMVERAKALIVHQNEHTAQLSDTTSEKSERPKRGRPKSIDKAARDMVAGSEKVTERQIRRRLEPDHPEPVAPKPPKPKPIDERLSDLLPGLETINTELASIRHSMDEAAKQFKWKDGDVRWRILQDLGKANAGVGSAKITVGELAERIKRANISVFTPPTRELGDKPAPGPGAGPKTGLGGRKLRIELPTVEETANAWADAAKVGVGPSDDEEAL